MTQNTQYEQIRIANKTQNKLKIEQQHNSIWIPTQIWKLEAKEQLEHNAPIGFLQTTPKSN